MNNFGSKNTEPTEGVQVGAMIGAFLIVIVLPLMLIMTCIEGCSGMFDAAFGPSPERDRARAEEQERYEAEVFAEYGETLEDRRARWKQLGDEAEWRRLRGAAELKRLLDDPTYLNDE